MFVFSVMLLCLSSSSLSVAQPVCTATTPVNLTVDNSVYSFGNLTTPLAYNGDNTCKWSVNCPVGYYILLQTTTHLASSDSFYIQYPANGYITQTTKSYPQDTFFLPSGLSVINFIANGNGQLAFRLTLMKLNNITSKSVTLAKNSGPVLLDVNTLATQDFLINNEASNTISLGMAVNNHDVINNTIPFPLRACFVYTGANRVFQNVLQDSVSFASLYTSNLVSIHCIVPMPYIGYVVAQRGELVNVKYYKTALITESSASVFNIGIDAVPNALTTVVMNGGYHTDMTTFSLTNITTTFSISSGGLGDQFTTYNQNNMSIPYESNSQITTYVVNKGWASFTLEAHKNVVSSTGFSMLLLLFTMWIRC